MNRLYLFGLIILLSSGITDALNRGTFSIKSKLPKVCGFTRRYAPDSEFELWPSWPWLGLFHLDGTVNNAILIHAEAALTSLFPISFETDLVAQQNAFVSFSLPGLIGYQNISVSTIDFPSTNKSKGYHPFGDVALLKFSKPIITSMSVHPVCLWEYQADYSQEIADHYIMIAGNDLENSYKPTEFRSFQALARVISKDKCTELMKNSTKTGRQNVVKKILLTKMCFKYVNEPRECHSSGSAMMIPRLTEEGKIVWYLRGVVPSLTYCSINDFQVAVDVGYQRAWIESHFNPSTEMCGRRSISHLSLVVLGEEAQRGDWPWHAALFYQGQYRCGATLISPNTLLTGPNTAHCLYSSSMTKISDEQLTVSLGKNNLQLTEHGEVTLSVNESIVHPGYNFTSFRNDIAILKLSESVIYSDYIQPACLWDENNIKKENIYYTTGTVVGWGLTENRTASSILRIAKVPIADDLLCHQSHETFFNNFLNENSFCAGNPFDNSTNVCNGDSGGGLMISQSQGDFEDSWYVRGIVSVTIPKDGTRICDPTKFTVYTDVAQYLPWIKQHSTPYYEEKIHFLH